LNPAAIAGRVAVCRIGLKLTDPIAVVLPV
jgi:hypothetical protein